MPLAVDSLTPDSGIPEVRQAISESVAQCIKEGGTQKECAGRAIGTARDKTGKGLPQG